jgi:DNA topoisomerase-1
LTLQSSYGLIICEKPDAAKRVAEALAGGTVESTRVHGVETFTCRDGDKNYVVCSALGHLYAISDSFPRRDVYPTFDLEWFPVNQIDKRSRKAQSRILAIRRLAANASYFINACDFDVEGQTIGYNLLRYACDGKEDVALRAKFSTLTKEELIAAISGAKVGVGAGLAKAGRVRHVLDFVWGINISRALAVSLATSDSGYRTISMGRVQGPTLAFVAEREIEIRNFVPTPYWKIVGLFDKDGFRFEAPHAIGRFLKKVDAESVKSRCEGKAGIVSRLTKSVFRDPPPAPFNTGDLQKEAYRVFGYSPSKTMRLAQRLYLDALISYPRTDSQKLPPAIKYEEILSRLGALREYTNLVEELMKRELRPREGGKVDQAHPAIYPTGEHPKKVLYSQELKLFDLIVRRFFACFAEDAVRERTSAEINVEEDRFTLTGRRILSSGWIRYYSKYAGVDEKPMPKLSESERLGVARIDCDEMFESRPARFNQGSLLEKMEREGIGTKATRADIISTLIGRGYIVGKGIEATDLGLSVIEIMREYSPQIISTSLTRETEKELEEIENGAGDETELIEKSIGLLAKQTALLKASEIEIGKQMSRSVSETTASQNTIGPCPVCKTGRLRIIRSAKTRKRFVGCTNYSHGCRASAPLPQRGTITLTGSSCSDCGWPVIYVRYGRHPWRLCVNMRCKSKGRQKTNAMQTL